MPDKVVPPKQRPPWVPPAEPETPVQSAAASTRAVPRVVASYALSVVYGPYPAAYAEQIAQQLNDGGWHEEYWQAVPLGQLPGEPPLPPSPPPVVDETERKQQLYRVLEQRQCEVCGSLNSVHDKDCPVLAKKLEG